MTEDKRNRGMQILWSFEYFVPAVLWLNQNGFSEEEIAELSGATLENVQKAKGTYKPIQMFPDDTAEQLLEKILIMGNRDDTNGAKN